MGSDRFKRQVKAPMAPITPAFNPAVLALGQTLLPLLLRVRLFPWLPAGIRAVLVENGDTLARCYQQFQQGRIRLILAFRHCEVDDPLCALHLLGHDLPRRGARLGLGLRHPLHAYFLFDRGMPLWAGRPLGWLLSRLGGISVRRGRHPDWSALRMARHLVLEGSMPFAVAPEGATNGHGERIGPLEPGVAQLGLWCVEDLWKLARPEEVVILPIALQYTYVRPRWDQLARLMGELERTIGLSPPPDPAPYPRLERIATELLDQLEAFYRHLPAPGSPLPPPPLTPQGSGDDFEPPAVQAARVEENSFGPRLERLMDRALATAEAHFALPGKGTTVDRCRRLEEAVWQQVHREDLPALGTLSPLELGLANRLAKEASLAEVHMRLAESFAAVTGTYVAERPTFERFMETTLLIHDALARLHGDGLPVRPRLGARRVRFTVGEPLSVSDRWAQAEAGIPPERPGRTRRASRQVITSLTEDIRRSYEQALGRQS